MRGLLLALLAFYKGGISPFLAPRCRFEPSCSCYAREAILVHGAWRGGALAARRLLRCHPVAALGGSFGFDPVPPHARQSRAR